jgi:hypothetical protein
MFLVLGNKLPPNVLFPRLFYFIEDFRLDCIEFFLLKEFSASDPSLVGVGDLFLF